MEDRVRSVDVQKMDLEQIEQLSERIGTKFQKLLDQMEIAMEDANRIFNVYGIEVKMEMAFYNKETGEKLK